MDPKAQVYVDGFVTREELFEMMRLGAVGEVTGWAYDAKGRLIKGGTNKRLTSIPPQVPAETATIAAAIFAARNAPIMARRNTRGSRHWLDGLKLLRIVHR